MNYNFEPYTTAEFIQKISQNTILEKNMCAAKTDACCNIVKSADSSEFDVKYDYYACAIIPFAE